MDRRWKVVLLVSVGEFMAFLDAPIVSIAFPSIEHTFTRSSATTIAWVLNAYFLGFAVFLIVAGKLADRYGRRRLFMAGLALFVISSVACGAAPSIGVLIAARSVQALAAATVVPAGQGLMLAVFPAHQRKTAIGALAAIVGFATAASPSVGGIIIDQASWRWIFYVNIIVGVAALLYGMRLLPADERPAQREPLPDFLGAVLQAIVVGFVVLALLKRADWGFGNWKTLVSLGVTLIALPPFLRRCSTHRSPVMELDLFRARAFSTANAASFLFAVGFFAITINGVLFLTSVWHYSILDTGLAITPGALFGMVFGLPAGMLSERHAGAVAVVGAFVAAIGIAVLVASTGDHRDYLGGWLPGALIYSAGAVTAFTALVGAAVTSAPPDQFGLATGINSAIRQIGGAVGVAFVIGIVGTPGPGDALHRTHTAFTVAMVALLLASVASLLTRVPQQSPTELTLAAVSDK